uniref:Xrn1 helical domain-containing protein n=1 Tax=Lygus hesperus TaxID=30085 RepID=A0A146M4T1_LYGHE
MSYKVAPWEGTIHIPFIDERRLFQAFGDVDETLLNPHQYKYKNNFTAPFVVVNKQSANRHLLKYSSEPVEEYCVHVSPNNERVFGCIENTTDILVKQFLLPKIPRQDGGAAVEAAYAKESKYFRMPVEVCDCGKYIPQTLPSRTTVASYPTLNLLPHTLVKSK